MHMAWNWYPNHAGDLYFSKTSSQQQSAMQFLAQEHQQKNFNKGKGDSPTSAWFLILLSGDMSWLTRDSNCCCSLAITATILPNLRLVRMRAILPSLKFFGGKWIRLKSFEILARQSLILFTSPETKQLDLKYWPFGESFGQYFVNYFKFLAPKLC